MSDAHQSGTDHQAEAPSSGTDGHKVDRSLVDELLLPTDMLDQGPMPIVVIDRDFNITRANQVLLDHLGVSRQDVIGRRLLDFLPSIPSYPLHEALRKARPALLRSCRITVADRPERNEDYWDLSVWPTGVGEDGAQGLFILAWEMTSHVKVMQQREDFMSVLAHNLNPALLGDHRALELMLSGALGKLPARQLEMISLLHKNNVSQMKMVQDLIEVFRYDTGTKQLELKRVDLGGLLDSCVSEIAPLAERIQVKLKATSALDLHKVYADEMSLHRLFVNLLSNAVKFSPNYGEIEVAAANLDEAVMVNIKDEGKGVLPEDEPRLFRRFWQGGSGASRVPGRIGIGLYLCARIVEAHHGEISYFKRPNGGSVFRVVLPLDLPALGITSQLFSIPN